MACNLNAFIFIRFICKSGYISPNNQSNKKNKIGICNVNPINKFENLDLYKYISRKIGLLMIFLYVF